MAMDTRVQSSGCNKNISKALSIHNHHLHDGSFSAYLSCSEEALVEKLPQTKKETNELLYLGRKNVEDGEIGVFGAEKYFNGVIDEENPRIAANYRHVKDEPTEMGPVKHKIQSGTPSVHSDSSSNSQSALLQRVVRTPPQRKNNKRQGKSLLTSIGCNCNGKNSVDIDDHAGESNPKGKTATKEPAQNSLEAVDFARTNKSWLKPLVVEGIQYSKIDEVRLGVNREDCFSFPILKSKPGNIAGIVNLQDRGDDKQRNSLEVFGSSVLDKKKKSLSLDRKVTMLTWDISERILAEEGSDEIYNDAESDASSDLFEIESFTNNSNSFLHRQSSDGFSSCVTPTTCYAPSEASIEWSVVTASAADYSMVSDSEDAISSSAAAKRAHKMAPHAKFGASKEMEKRRTGILSGCKSHKAVRVVGDAYRTTGRAVPGSPRRHRPDSLPPVTRFQAS